MPEERKYLSLYGASDLITAPQKLAEMACERIARFLGVELISRFWLQSDWKKTFGMQVKHANKLLKIYDVEAIMRAWKAAPKTRSLGASFFTEYVEREQAKLDMATEKAGGAGEVVVADASQPPRTPIKRQDSVRSKLRGL